MRLDKMLSSALGLGSRTDVKKFIKNGRVTVTGIEKLRPETNINPEKSEIYFDGVLQTYREFVYLMLNKPQGCVSATYDKNYPVVTDYVPNMLKHFEVFPVGRLDIDTEGLCLLTNDGELAHRILSPKNHVPKKYYALLDVPAEKSDIEKFKGGIEIDDGYKCMSAELIILPKNNLEVEVIIHEGKFHQVKRMFDAVGKNVVFLKRLSMKNLVLDENLKPGEIRELTLDEISELKN